MSLNLQFWTNLVQKKDVQLSSFLGILSALKTQLAHTKYGTQLTGYKMKSAPGKSLHSDTRLLTLVARFCPFQTFIRHEHGTKNLQHIYRHVSSSISNTKTICQQCYRKPTCDIRTLRLRLILIKWYQSVTNSSHLFKCLYQID